MHVCCRYKTRQLWGRTQGSTSLRADVAHTLASAVPSSRATVTCKESFREVHTVSDGLSGGGAGWMVYGEGPCSALLPKSRQDQYGPGYTLRLAT